VPLPLRLVNSTSLTPEPDTSGYQTPGGFQSAFAQPYQRLVEAFTANYHTPGGLESAFAQHLPATSTSVNATSSLLKTVIPKLVLLADFSLHLLNPVSDKR
jgi:hypothetical protein